MYLKDYLNRIGKNKGLAESVNTTATEIGNKYLKTFTFMNHEVGLLFGNVQSGKTGQMFGIINKAADLCFPVFIILTTDNVVLQQQTLQRVQKDFEGFCICDETNTTKFMDNNLMLPTIVVLKKNVRILRLWANTIASTGFMKGNPLFIVDDEADTASLNTLVNKDKQSSINKHLEAIKQGTSSSIYLQVTATPQALLLQTMISGWHPYFIHYFEPGNGYLGGDYFFPQQKPNCIEYLENIEKPERNVLVRHIAVTSQIFATGGKVCNCLIHPSVRQAIHEKFAKTIKEEINWCLHNIDGQFTEELKSVYEQLEPAKTEKVSFDVIETQAKKLLKENLIKVLVMNGKNNISNDEYEQGCNIVIGGNTLGRGVTFPCLQTIYYTRTSKKPLADTMWQHSRMFGYDRDSGLMKVYIDEKLYKLFADINATNNSLISQIVKGYENIQIHYPQNIQPTRKDVIDNRSVYALTGGTNYYPFEPENDSIEQLDNILSSFDEKEPYYQISLKLVIDLLRHIKSGSDFIVEHFINTIETILADKPTSQAILIVRRNRNITKGTGALLSPNDWKLGGDITDKTVLTMYKMSGNASWNNKQLWVPNIKLPTNNVFFNIKETD